MLLSIITPTYNEAKNVEKLIKLIEVSLNKYKYEIIFVDDDSTDKTHEIIKKIAFKKKKYQMYKKNWKKRSFFCGN